MTDADPRDMVIGVVARRAGIRPEEVSPDARLLQDLHLDGDSRHGNRSKAFTNPVSPGEPT